MCTKYKVARVDVAATTPGSIKETLGKKGALTAARPQLREEKTEKKKEIKKLLVLTLKDPCAMKWKEDLERRR